MPMTEAQIKTERLLEYGYMLKQFQLMSAKTSTSTFTVGSGKNRTKCSVEAETEGKHLALKIDSIRKAVTMVLQKGFAVDDLHFRIDSTDKVANAAYISDASGNRRPIIQLGGKFWGTDQSTAVASKFGATGVPNQVYDGTTRWFGNPKQKAFGTIMVVHEIGHVLHEAFDPAFFWSNKSPGNKEKCTVAFSQWGNDAIDVSTYATTSSVEFVAECFAGVLSGRRYSAKVQAAYKTCSGPVPDGASFF